MRFQFSIRSALVITALAAALFAAMRAFGVEPLAEHAAAIVVFAWVGALLLMAHRSAVAAADADPLSPRTVASFSNDVDAALLVDELANQGVRAHAVGNFTSGFRAEAPGEIQVVVAQQDEPRAQQVVAHFKPEAGDVDWTKVNTGDPDPVGPAEA